MSETGNASRGDRTVNLGELGPVVCRPGLRSLEAIDVASGTILEALRRLARGGSLRDVITILYETHLDYANAERSVKRFTREQIGEAVIAVGINTLVPVCAELVGSAFAVPKADDEGDDPGNG